MNRKKNGSSSILALLCAFSAAVLLAVPGCSSGDQDPPSDRAHRVDDEETARAARAFYDAVFLTALGVPNSPYIQVTSEPVGTTGIDYTIAFAHYFDPATALTLTGTVTARNSISGASAFTNVYSGSLTIGGSDEVVGLAVDDLSQEHPEASATKYFIWSGPAVTVRYVGEEKAWPAAAFAGNFPE